MLVQKVTIFYLVYNDYFMAYLILVIGPLPSFILEAKPLPSLIVVAKPMSSPILMAKPMQMHVLIAMLVFISLGLRASIQCPNMCHFYSRTLNLVHAIEVNCV